MKRVLIIFLLLALPLATAQLEDPKQINSIDLKFITTGTLKTDGNIKYIYLKLYSFPKTDYFSTVSSIDTEPVAELKKDEDQWYYYYTWDSDLIQQDGDYLEGRLSQTQLDYSLTAYIKSRFVLPKVTEKQEFPYEPLDMVTKRYTQATAKIDSSNAEIKQLANNLASGESDAYKVALKFAKYVNEIMTYDTDFLEGTQKASWVLENKKGVCDEYVVLFMALSRAVGLPVRYVSGAAFSNVDNEYIPHAWAEVWFPDAGWIPFDPTYNEFGWVDATHIKMQTTNDVEVSAIKYIWEVGDVEGEQPDVKVTTSNKETGLPNYLTGKLWVEESKVGFGSYNIVWMRLDNLMDYYITPEVALTKAPQIVENNPQYVLLEPHSSALVYWIVKVPSALDEAYSYTYSIESSAMFTAPEAVSFVADPNAKILKMTDINKKLKLNVTEPENVQPELAVSISKPEKAYLGKPFDIRVTAANNANVAIPDLKICLENDCQQEYLGISDETTKTFTLVRNSEGDSRIKLTITGQGMDVKQEITVYIKRQTFFDVILDWLSSLFS